MDRSQAEQLGITGDDIAHSVLVSLSGSFQTAPTFFLDPKNGVSYNVAVQAPQYNISSLQDLENLPLHGTNSSASPRQSRDPRSAIPSRASFITTISGP